MSLQFLKNDKHADDKQQRQSRKKFKNKSKRETTYYVRTRTRTTKLFAPTMSCKAN